MTAPALEHVTEVLWHVDNECEARGWDQPPRLLQVIHMPTPDGAVVALGDVPGFDEIRTRTDDMQTILRLLTKVYSGLDDTAKAAVFPQQGYFGLVLVTEAWMLRGDDVRPGARPSRDKNRVEVRVTHLSPLDYGPAALLHERDGIVQVKVGEDGPLVGGVPDRMAELTLALRVSPP